MKMNQNQERNKKSMKFDKYMESAIYKNSYHSIVKKHMNSNLQTAKRMIKNLLESESESNIDQKLESILLGLVERAYDKGHSLSH